MKKTLHQLIEPNHASFASLGAPYTVAQVATPLAQPYWIARSTLLANSMGLTQSWWNQPDALGVCSGNLALPQPAMASVYSGHQFGVWAGQLGDGRALLLGETENGLEIQLKGAGPTPYSRGGDGRAVLRSSLREFLASEAMFALNIPTTRALCVVGSDDAVQREIIETAAVVTRVAPSFIRFGHFEHFAATQQDQALRGLADFVIHRYFSACLTAVNPYAALLAAVVERTAHLIAHWQAIGFCHGVMNTDNMSILGLTLDYGPFQFLDGFNPQHICNHSDSQGRYAYDQQPRVAYWNLFCLGQALMPLINDETQARAALEPYKAQFSSKLTALMSQKLGLQSTQMDDAKLADDLRQLLGAEKVDYSIFWRRLSHFVQDDVTRPLHELFEDPRPLEAWLLRYRERLQAEDRKHSAQSMLQVNPKFILRNHLGEQAIQAAQRKEYAQTTTLCRLLQSPYDEHPEYESYADLPPPWASDIAISCSS